MQCRSVAPMAALLVCSLLATATGVQGSGLPLTGCSQSSLGWGGVCSRAIDGNTNQNYGSGSCTHTNLENSAWWAARTQRPAHIQQVKIFNRLDCCSDRLTNFVITVDGRECASYNSSAFSVKTFQCNEVGSVIKIKSRKMTYLTLCEVQVFGGYLGTQLSLAGCSQSWAIMGGACRRAIDGNTNQNYSCSSCFHTNLENSAWWAAWTLRLAHIKYVKIFSRLDCRLDKLMHFMITVDDQECASYDSGAFSVKTFQCNKTGSIITIRSLSTELTLCEVQVFGDYASENLGAQLSLAGCSQSSLSSGGVCSRAIDANTNQNYDGSSCSRTKFENSAWWAARTQRPAHIKYVKIFNRLDCCSDRLTNFVITVDGQECASYNSGAFSVKNFQCNEAGSNIKIQSRKRTYLTLCEVQVFGNYVDQVPVETTQVHIHEEPVQVTSTEVQELPPITTEN